MPTIEMIRDEITKNHERITAGALKFNMPEAHLTIMNMTISEAIKNYRLWPDGIPSKNARRLDFIYLVSGTGEGFSGLDANWHKAFWHWLKPYADATGWHLNPDASTLLTLAMREHYEAKLPQAVPA